MFVSARSCWLSGATLSILTLACQSAEVAELYPDLIDAKPRDEETNPCKMTEATVVVLAQVERTVGIAVGGGYVYWATHGPGEQKADGTIARVPTSGGDVEVLATGQSLPWSLTIDDTHVFWVNGGTSRGFFRDGAVMKLPLQGGEPVTLASDQDGPLGIAVDKTRVHWTGHDGRIQRVAKSGGEPETLASGQGDAWPIAVDTSAIYWATSRNVMRMPLEGGEPAVLASDQLNPRAMALTDRDLYWTTLGGVYGTGDGTLDYRPPTVMRLSLANGAWVTLAAGLPTLFGLAVDATRLVWGGGSFEGAVYACPLSGCGPDNSHAVTLACGQRFPWQVAIDATSVYGQSLDGIFKIAGLPSSTMTE